MNDRLTRQRNAFDLGSHYSRAAIALGSELGLGDLPLLQQLFFHMLMCGERAKIEYESRRALAVERSSEQAIEMHPHTRMQSSTS